jgi:2-polyprenyl-3-methyl-5-hydroxy-6-metoxy-1,4-benzoquinol methylase
MEPRGDQLILRYRSNYTIPSEVEITEEMILNHWELEKQLTRKLLTSTPETRWETFEQGYSQLYRELDWLNRLSRPEPVDTRQYAIWLAAIGKAPQKIYEIGSGEGKLITYLAQCGFDCKGTEITRERGAKHVSESIPNLSWGNSDGIHLQQFEPAASYDVALSCQVVEHMHPDDLVEHLRGCAQILKSQGRYIFSTPHRFTGPHDVSAVFNYDLAGGMHLKEYRYCELVAAVKQAGYSTVYCPLPPKIQAVCDAVLGKVGIQSEASLGRAYLTLMLGLEAMLGLVPSQPLRRSTAKLLRRLLLFRDNIFLVAQK